MDKTPTILVVDDELSIRESFGLILSDTYRVIQAASGEGAVKQAADNAVDLIYLDIRMPGMDGIETLKRLKEITPRTDVIMVTAVNDVQKASEAIKLGAYDYIIKPFDVEKIQGLTGEALRKKGLAAAVKGMGEKKPPALIGSGEKMKEIKRAVSSIAKSDRWALIAGEPGVEKKWIATLVHEESGKEGPFFAYDLKGKGEGEMEKDLFGSSAGSTAADIRKKEGLAYETGTLFIDNIDLLPHEWAERLSGSPARILGGTSLPGKVHPKIAGVEIKVPPLRERNADLPMLIDHFFETAAAGTRTALKEIPPDVKEALASYSWPGNMTELRAVIERLVLTAVKPKAEMSDLPLNILASSSSYSTLPADETFSGFEKEFISAVMDRCSSDAGKAAKMLRVAPQVLKSKL